VKGPAANRAFLIVGFAEFAGRLAATRHRAFIPAIAEPTQNPVFRRREGCHLGDSQVPLANLIICADDQS
jgi:hypothetical protein